MSTTLLADVLLPAGTRADVLLDDGVIASVGAPGALAGDVRVDATRRLVLPGLVNAHFHSSENWFKGRFDRLPLEPWMLFSYPPLLAPEQTPREIYVRTLLGAVELLRGGCTTVVDFLYELHGFTGATVDAVVRAYRDAGLRALVVLGMSDLAWADTLILDATRLGARAREALRDDAPPTWAEWEGFTRDMVAAHHRPEEGIAIGLGPSGPQRCTDAMLAGCARLARELGLCVHIHVLETRMQAESGRRRWGTTLPARLDALGFLGPEVCFEHAIWLEDDDVSRMARHGVKVAHNPVSNLKLGSGVCDVRALRRAGISVGLGTDGSSSNDGADMFACVKTGALLHRGPDTDFEDWLGARDLWDMGTRGGAASTPWDAVLGRVEPGAAADLLLLDLDHRAYTPLHQPVRQTVFTAPSSALTDVFVRGRRVLADGEIATFDERALLADARAAGRAVTARFAAADTLADDLMDAVTAGWRAVAA